MQGKVNKNLRPKIGRLYKIIPPTIMVEGVENHDIIGVMEPSTERPFILVTDFSIDSRGPTASIKTETITFIGNDIWLFGGTADAAVKNTRPMVVNFSLHETSKTYF